MDRRLFLLRHGIAVDAYEVGMASDADRPLTDKGRRRVKLVARALKEMAEPDDLCIVTSPLLRARQTGQVVAEELGNGTAITSDPRLAPMADPQRLPVLFLEQNTGGCDMLLVGHQPHLSRSFSYLLTGEESVSVDMKEAGLACLSSRSPGFRPPARLNWLITPEWVRKMYGDDTW